MVIYTAQPQDLLTELMEDFCSKYPGITYEAFRSGSGDVKTKLSTEIEAGGTDACILWIADLPYLYDLDDKGMILHYTPDGIEEVADECKYGDGLGNEPFTNYVIIAYNTLAVSEENAPKDWNDILDESYRGMVALANPAYSGAALTSLAVHIQNSDIVGWDWYKALLANDVKMEQSNGTLSTKLASGEYKAIVSLDYMTRNAKAEGAPVDYVYPESGCVQSNCPICLISTMPEEDLVAAKAFVDYTFDMETQKLFASQGYVPAISEAAEGSNSPRIDEIKVMPIDVDYMRANIDSLLVEYIDMFGSN